MKRASEGALLQQAVHRARLSDNKLVVTFGLKDTLVVDTPDVLLVADKRRVQDLKAVLRELRRRGRSGTCSAEGSGLEKGGCGR